MNGKCEIAGDHSAGPKDLLLKNGAEGIHICSQSLQRASSDGKDQRDWRLSPILQGEEISSLGNIDKNTDIQ